MRLAYVLADYDGPAHYRCIYPARELEKRGHSWIEWPHYRTEQSPEGVKAVKAAAMYGTGAQKAAGRAALAEIIRQPHALDRIITVHDFFKVPLDCDLVVLQSPKGVTWGTDGKQRAHWPLLIEKLHELGKIVVGEVDDYWGEIPSYVPGSKLGRFERKTLELAFERCDAVTVSTPFLRDYYSQFNPNTVCIRNYLHWPDWENIQKPEFRKFRIGWRGNPNFKGGDLSVLRGVIGPWLERHPEVEFVVSGGGSEQVHELLGVPKAQRVSVAAVNFWDGTVPEITAVMDVCLAPMLRNDFNEAKSHLTGLEMAACGIPVIASPTESYRWWVDEGETGFLAAKPADWTRRLDLLLADEELRQRMGALCRAKAERHTIQEYVGEWEAFYLGLDADNSGAERVA